MFDEAGPSLPTVHEPTVLVPLAVVPTSDSEAHLDSPLLVVGQLRVIFCNINKHKYQNI